MLEEIMRVRGQAACVHQLRLVRLLQGSLQLLVGDRKDGSDELIRKLAPDGGTDLYDFSRRSQPVESGHQGILQCGRNRAGDRPFTAFYDESRELLDEEG